MRINLRPRMLTGLEEKVLRMRYGLRTHTYTLLEKVTVEPQAARTLAQLEQRLLAQQPPALGRRR